MFKLALCQMSTFMDKEDNKARAKKLVEEAVSGGAQVVVLPENLFRRYVGADVFDPAVTLRKTAAIVEPGALHHDPLRRIPLAAREIDLDIAARRRQNAGNERQKRQNSFFHAGNFTIRTRNPGNFLAGRLPR